MLQGQHYSFFKKVALYKFVLSWFLDFRRIQMNLFLLKKIPKTELKFTYLDFTVSTLLVLVL